MRRHPILSAVAIAAAALAYLTSPGIATADVVTHKCGKPVSSIVKTSNNASFSTNSTSFKNLPGSTTTVDVGDGGCIKVRLFAEMRCSQTADPDFCTFRVSETDGFLDPQVNGVTFIGEGAPTGYSTHSFAWVGEFGPGKHKIAVEAGVQKPATTMNVQVWTLEIEVTK